MPIYERHHEVHIKTALAQTLEQHILVIGTGPIRTVQPLLTQTPYCHVHSWSDTFLLRDFVNCLRVTPTEVSGHADFGRSRRLRGLSNTLMITPLTLTSVWYEYDWGPAASPIAVTHSLAASTPRAGIISASAQKLVS